MKLIIPMCLLSIYMVLYSPAALSLDVESKQQPENLGPTNSDDPICPKVDVDTNAVVVKAPVIESSYQALSDCAEGKGTVVLKAILQASGKVTDVEVARASPCGGFDKKAAKAVRKIKFTPAKKGGVAVSVCADYKFSYEKLRNP